jgi:hypothetical protein
VTVQIFTLFSLQPLFFSAVGDTLSFFYLIIRVRLVYFCKILFALLIGNEIDAIEMRFLLFYIIFSNTLINILYIDGIAGSSGILTIRVKHSISYLNLDVCVVDKLILFFL